MEATIEEERGYYTVVIWDWNAKLGSDLPPSKERFIEGKSNASGEKLCNLAVSNKSKGC